jgi:hypothetical protein
MRTPAAAFISVDVDGGGVVESPDGRTLLVIFGLIL